MAGHSRLKDGAASARLCPAIHALASAALQDVDARHKAGHDERESISLSTYVFDSTFFQAKVDLRLSNSSTFTPLRRMMKLCCSTDRVLFQAQ
jgi:hypothetical protein